MALTFTSPIAIMCYALAAVGFLCLVSSKAGTAEYYPERCIKQNMEQARHIYSGKKSNNPILQLNRYACALAFISSARTLAPNSTSILKLTRVDPTELAGAIQKAARPLLQRASIENDEFKAAFA